MVDAGTGIGTGKLLESVFVFNAVLGGDDDAVGIDISDRTLIVADQACTGVFCDLRFNTCTDVWSMWPSKRNRLSLHVGAH